MIIANHLVEPNMAIQRSPAAEKYDRLIEERNGLRANGIQILDDGQKTLIVLVNMMEAELDKNCRRIAGEKITERAHSPKLSQRFLCAVWPRYLDARPTDGWVVEKARDAALAFYDKSLAEVRRAAEPQDYTLASVLEGSITVKKPLQLKKPQPQAQP